jgi:hypothetical protein
MIWEETDYPPDPNDHIKVTHKTERFYRHGPAFFIGESVLMN